MTEEENFIFLLDNFRLLSEERRAFLKKRDILVDPLWKSCTEPPDTDRLVLLRFGPHGHMDRCGRYFADIGGYSTSYESRKKLRFVHPTYWKELKDDVE